jgi:hypothetical protein
LPIPKLTVFATNEVFWLTVKYGRGGERANAIESQATARLSGRRGGWIWRPGSSINAIEQVSGQLPGVVVKIERAG